MGPELKPESPLPRTFVLAYAPNRSAPTEVRRATARAMFLLGSCFLLVAAAIFVDCVIYVYQWYSSSTLWGAQSMADRLQDMCEGLLDDGGWIYAIPLASVGLPILCCSPFVKRGSRWACCIGLLVVAPAILAPCLCAAVLIVLAFVSLFSAGGPETRWWALLFLPAAAFAAGVGKQTRTVHILESLQLNPAIV